jgi:rhodanese-related sulfurtransferase
LDFILHNIGWVILLVASGIMLIWPEIQGTLGQQASIGTLEATQLINQRHAIVIDLRRPEDFANGHLPAARHIPADELATRGEEIGRFKSRPVILVATGNTSPGKATQQLKLLGFEDVFVLRGGLSAWVEANLPIEKSTAKA